jgi:hypothetical protein
MSMPDPFMVSVPQLFQVKGSVELKLKPGIVEVDPDFVSIFPQQSKPKKVIEAGLKIAPLYTTTTPPSIVISPE